MLGRCKYNCLNNTNLGHRWWLYHLNRSNIHLLWWSELLKSFTKNSVKQKLVISFQAGYQPFHGKSSFLCDRAERSTWPPFTDADCKKHTDWETLSSRRMIKAHVFQNVKHLFTDKIKLVIKIAWLHDCVFVLKKKKSNFHMHCCNALRKNTYFESFILDIYAVDKLKNWCFFSCWPKTCILPYFPHKKYFKKYKQTKLAKKYIYSVLRSRSSKHKEPTCFEIWVTVSEKIFIG